MLNTRDRLKWMVLKVSRDNCLLLPVSEANYNDHYTYMQYLKHEQFHDIYVETGLKTSD